MYIPVWPGSEGLSPNVLSQGFPSLTTFESPEKLFKGSLHPPSPRSYSDLIGLELDCPWVVVFLTA